MNRNVLFHFFYYVCWQVINGVEERSPFVTRRACGTNNPGTVQSTSNTMTVLFHTDLTTSARGFSAHYDSLYESRTYRFAVISNLFVYALRFCFTDIFLMLSVLYSNDIRLSKVAYLIIYHCLMGLFRSLHDAPVHSAE